jgi:hypothetical protein
VVNDCPKGQYRSNASICHIGEALPPELHWMPAFISELTVDRFA